MRSIHWMMAAFNSRGYGWFKDTKFIYAHNDHGIPLMLALTVKGTSFLGPMVVKWTMLAN